MKVEQAVSQIIGIKTQCLLSYGFTFGHRNPNVNRSFPGAFMVIEAHEESKLPTDDGGNGPWCLVGDDLDVLVECAFDYLVGCEA